MTEKSTSDEMVDAALGEHRECMQAVSELESCLEGPVDRSGQWVGDVLEVLPRLAASLREHFAAEQDGALFRKLPLTHPQYADRLQRLETEHREILEKVDEVIGKAEGVDRGKLYEVRELNAQVQMLVATIRRHEAEETEILMGAHWEEIGAGD